MSLIRLGISRCLLGDHVRYDGQHKHDQFLTDTLGRYVEYIGVCPEVECGLHVPRESMSLVGSVDTPRLMTRENRRDLTRQMLEWVTAKLSSMEKESFCGFIFKSKSPSCGIDRVKVYSSNGMPVGSTSGLFAREFMKKFPLLPVEDEGRLHDPEIRENFLDRIFTLNRYREAVAGGRTSGGLMKFHAEHKLLLMAHSEKHCREMGRLLARSSEGLSLVGFRTKYETLLMNGLKCMGTVKKHVNVLQHMLGYFRKLISSDERQEMVDIINQYAKGNLPLIVPLTLFRHYVRKYKVGYLDGQYYLRPHPVEQMLKNHV